MNKNNNIRIDIDYIMSGKHKIEVFISPNDILIAENAINNNRTDYKEITKEIVKSHCDSDNVLIDDDTLNKYIDELIKTNPQITEFFDDKENDKYANFVHLLKKYYSNYTSGRIEISQTINRLSEVYTKVLTHDVLTASFDSIRNSINNITKAISTTFNINMLDSINNSISNIVNAIKNIHFSYSDEDKNELIKAYADWGRLGWTFSPHMDLDFIKNIPNDAKKANRIMDNYYRKNNDLKYILNELNNARLKQDDLTEALKDYELGHYKSCSMILFGLIDSILIRNKYNKKGNRKTGEGAIKIIKAKTIDVNDYPLFVYLAKLNLYNALSTFFIGGDNFKIQHNIINRNLLDHGMMYKKVKKRDCIQLFLALYNSYVIIKSKL